MTRELVIGASGLIGSHLLADAQQHGAAAGTYHTHPVAGLRALDLTDEDATAGLLDEVEPDVVYLPAANPNVEWVEANPQAARALNVEAPAMLARRLRDTGAKLVYYSSDYVFDGTAGPYREEDAPNPLSEYARQKAEVETMLAAMLENWLVLRVTVVYGWDAQAKNFAARAVKTLRAGGQVKAPVDQFNNPTYAPDLAAASRALAARDARGIFHLAGKDVCHRCDFAREIAAVFGLDEALVVPVTTTELAQRAARPLRAGMIVEKAQAVLDFPLRGYREALRQMREDEADAWRE